MSDGFYRAFEDKHRGTLALIKERQSIYLPLIRPLLEIYPRAPAIDLGCGRGEWLELLTETGFDALGIDLDDGMLAECRARGLTVQTQDALTALKALPDNSQAIVSGFQFAEHIPFEVLQELVQQAMRVLLPAGLLILETPNPENVVVGTTNFYLDPTHNRPLPPLLMEFLAEYYGFCRFKIVRLQEPVNLADSRRFSIHDVLGGVSPDYALVAQKAAPQMLLDKVSSAFDVDRGVTLGMISGRYEQQQAELVQEVDRALDRRINDLDRTLNTLVADVDRALDRRMLVIERRLDNAELRLHLIESRRFVSRCKRLLRKIGSPVLARLKSYLASHPETHARLVQVAQKVGAYRVLHLILNKGASAGVSQGPVSNAPDGVVDSLLADKPQAVRQMYGDLDQVIKKSGKR